MLLHSCVLATASRLLTWAREHSIRGQGPTCLTQLPRASPLRPPALLVAVLLLLRRWPRQLVVFDDKPMWRRNMHPCAVACAAGQRTLCNPLVATSLTTPLRHLRPSPQHLLRREVPELPKVLHEQARQVVQRGLECSAVRP